MFERQFGLPARASELERQRRIHRAARPRVGPLQLLDEGLGLGQIQHGER